MEWPVHVLGRRVPACSTGRGGAVHGPVVMLRLRYRAVLAKCSGLDADLGIVAGRISLGSAHAYIFAVIH